MSKDVSIKNLSRKKIIIMNVVAIAIIILIVFSIIIFKGGKHSIHQDDFIVNIDKEKVTVNEIFNITIISKIKNANISWNLGDGTTRYGEKISHVYYYSSFFNININITVDENIFNRNISIPVKNRNMQVFGGGDGFRDISVVTTRARGIFWDIESSINYPNVTININCINAFGEVGVIIFLSKYEGNIIREIELDNTVQTRFNEDINYQRTFILKEHDDIDFPFSLHANIFIENGRIGPWDALMSFEY